MAFSLYSSTLGHTLMSRFSLRSFKECTLCVITLAVVAGAPILVSIFVLVWD